MALSRPTSLASITVPQGFVAAGGCCGIKESGRPDLALIAADQPCSAAAVFTTNQFKGAPVLVGMKHLNDQGFGTAQAIVCNSGNSNVATLAAGGYDHAIDMCKTAAGVVGCDPHDVLPASTGVIGRPLPIDRVLHGIASLKPDLGRGEPHDIAAAQGIMTTDLVEKTTLQTFKIDGKTCHIGGIGKGSGMIAPSMATMLVFVTTDVAIDPAVLHEALSQANAASFNRISVDSDTSTSDTVYILASGAAGNAPIKDTDSQAYQVFKGALELALCDLAEQVVVDGEGATRTFLVEVNGTRSVQDADKIGKAVTDSPLVKTAIHGCDPNWGRLVMAAGKAGVELDPARFTVQIQGVTVFENNTPAVTEEGRLAELSEKMRTDRVHIHLNAHLGTGCSKWLGCDLSRQYIAINADYTT
ncbi:MAG: bifunctional glutamate N-acetyltransferase/amino-acid acetyltransferase ArgJ [Phycisphaeraceae bacterium]|nr:bifunctional glutamate N-acetyltransferase/amino-acid acetyltransferase ArgJ [Phycisphaeraceae bacterium]